MLLHTGAFKFSLKFCFLLKKKFFQVTFFREGEISYDTPYMWNLKRNDTKNLLTRQRPTDFENDLMVAQIVTEFGIDMYPRLFLKWILLIGYIPIQNKRLKRIPSDFKEAVANFTDQT